LSLSPSKQKLFENLFLSKCLELKALQTLKISSKSEITFVHRGWDPVEIPLNNKKVLYQYFIFFLQMKESYIFQSMINYYEKPWIWKWCIQFYLSHREILNPKFWFRINLYHIALLICDMDFKLNFIQNIHTERNFHNLKSSSAPCSFILHEKRKCILCNGQKVYVSESVCSLSQPFFSSQKVFD
jgi:hypothetical protein